METTPVKSNDEIIKEAKAAFKGQWGDVIVALILSSLVGAAIYGVMYLAILLVCMVLNVVFSSSIVGLLGILLYAIGVIIGIIFQGRIWNWQNDYILRKSRGEQVSNTDFKAIFEGLSSIQDLKPFLLNKDNLYKNLIPAITQVLYTVCILVGYVLLVIPGVIISFMFALVPFISTEERELQPAEVLKKSTALMDGYKMKLFQCYVKLIPQMLLCLITCGIALFWFVPFLSFVMARFYDAHRQPTAPSAAA